MVDHMQARRRRMMQAVLLTAVAPRAVAEGTPPETAATPFQWAVRSPQVERLREELERSRAILSPGEQEFRPPPEQASLYLDGAFSPLVLVVGAVALSVLLDAALKWYREYGTVGWLVDATQSPVQVRELPSAPRGTITVIPRSGPPVMLQASQATDVAAVMRAVMPAPGK